MKPLIKTLHNGYEFTYAAEKVIISVTRLHMHSDGRVTGILQISNPEKQVIYTQSTTNFTAPRSRSSLAKELSDRDPARPWTEIIDQVSKLVIDLLSEGEPLELITSVDDVKPLEYLIKPILPLNKPTALFGFPGAGKSQISIVLIIALTIPWIENPLKIEVIDKSSKCLFLDYEAESDDHRRQLVSLTNNLELGYIELNYRRCSLPLAGDMEAIQNHIENLKANCVIIDSTSLAAGGDLNNMQVATEYTRTLRQLKGITTLSLAHTNKTDAKEKTILGSTLFEAGFRNVIEIRGHKEDMALDVALFHRKSNYAGEFKPLGWRFTYGSGGMMTDVDWHNPKDVPEFMERMHAQDRIKRLLLSGGIMSVPEIAKELEITEGSCRTALSRMKKIIIKTEKGYGILQQEGLE